MKTLLSILTFLGLFSLNSFASDDTTAVTADTIKTSSKIDTAIAAADTIDTLDGVRYHVSEALKDAKKEIQESIEEAQRKINEINQEMQKKIAEVKKELAEQEQEDSIDRAEDTIDAREAEVELKKDEHDKGGSGISRSKIKGFGGGISISPMLTVIPLQPVKDLIAQDPLLRNYQFNLLNEHNYRALMSMGVLIYGGLGNGIRIGFGGTGASFTTGSEPQSDDTMAILQINQSYCGFFMEKAIVQGNMNWVFGGILGGGSLEVKRDFQYEKEPTAFTDIFDGKRADDLQGAKAVLGGIELHGGFTYSMLPWLHVGTDVNVFFGASTGFGGARSDAFYEAVPGLRLRLVLGNLG